MIELKGLTKSFGHIRAVRGVDLRVEPGEVLGFLGPNGAGKSTTMKMVTGFLSPSSGTALVCGHDVTREKMEARRRIGYLPEGAPAYPDMTPMGFLRFCAEVRGLGGKARRDAVARAVELVDLRGVVRQPIETLSKGYKRRVGLAQAILHDPEVLILDEPTDGLDPNQKHEVRRLIKEMAAGSRKVIVLSTHILEEVDAVCTRAVIIARGQKLADGTPRELRGMARDFHEIVVRCGSVPVGVEREVSAVEGVGKVEREGVELRVWPKDGATPEPAVVRLLVSKGVEVHEVRVERGSLDSVFRSLTAKGGAA